MEFLASSGACTGADYPYFSGITTKTETCIDSYFAHTPLSISKVVPINGEEAIESVLSTTPVSIIIEAGNSAFQYYQSGIITSGCSKKVDHAVVAVGYGTDGIPFFKLKNSWSQDWGENGFFRIQRGVGGDGMCGLAMYPTYPVITSSST
ncbi:cysteine proteinase EP-B 2-like, partial [Thraustotheca clavata]